MTTAPTPSFGPKCAIFQDIMGFSGTQPNQQRPFMGMHCIACTQNTARIFSKPRQIENPLKPPTTSERSEMAKWSLPSPGEKQRLVCTLTVFETHHGFHHSPWGEEVVWWWTAESHASDLVVPRPKLLEGCSPPMTWKCNAGPRRSRSLTVTLQWHCSSRHFVWCCQWCAPHGHYCTCMCPRGSL